MKVYSPQNNTDFNQGVLHLWSKFGDPSLNGSWVIAQTSKWLTHRWTDRRTHRRRQQYPKAKTGLGQKWLKMPIHVYTDFPPLRPYLGYVGESSDQIRKYGHHSGHRTALLEKKIFEICSENAEIFSGQWPQQKYEFSNWKIVVCKVVMSRSVSQPILKIHFDGLVQERRNSIANALELHLSCTKPSLYSTGVQKAWFHFTINHAIFHENWAINSLGPSDTIWRQGSGSTLAEVMACCLSAPSHYLKQCWLIISRVQLHSSAGNFRRDTSVVSD